MRTKNYAAADITGRRFGRLTAICATGERDGKGYVIWHCRCDCGNETDASYNSLMYGNQQSCGCKKKEHYAMLGTYLTHIDGTSIDALKSTKLPDNNTTGIKGVYLVKGRYKAKIVFQKRQLLLGTYETLSEAAEARKKAEDLLKNGVVGYYDRWASMAAADPAWASANPLRFHVCKNGAGELELRVSPEVLMCNRDAL